MDVLCKLCIHDWKFKATARPGVSVYRCRRCNALIRTSRGHRRRKKRFYLLGIVSITLLFWYVIVALGLTGHSKLLWGAEHIARGADHISREVDHRIKKAAGAPQ